MEPIFKNKHFASILKIWQFLRHWADALGLEYRYQSISLYQVQAYIHEEKVLSKFIDSLIKKLLSKVERVACANQSHSTIFGISRFNKFQVFQQLIETSSFQLGHSLVNQALIRQGEAQLKQVQSFEMLDIGQKYQYLRILINYVQSSYIKRVKSEILNEKLNESKKLEESFKANTEQANGQKPQQKANKPIMPSKRQQQKLIQKSFFQKSVQFIVLGITQDKNIFIFCQQIPDRIMIFDSEMEQWTHIVGKQDLRMFIIQLINKGQYLSPDQSHLLQNLDIVYQQIRQVQLVHVFRPFKGLIQQKPKCDKSLLIKEYLKNMQNEYSKFLGDCWNGRWASKQQRKQFLQKVEQAKDIPDLLIVFKQFYNKTLTSYSVCNSQGQVYDYDILRPEHDISFKTVALRFSNYLYFKQISVYSDYVPHPYGLISILPKFFDNSSHIMYHAEYLIISLKSMISIIAGLYPSCLKNRKIKIQRQKQEKNKQANIQKLKGQLKDVKIYHNVYDSQDQSSSAKTVLKNDIAQNAGGRSLRLRKNNKMAFIQESSSKKVAVKRNVRNSKNTRSSNQNQQKKAKKDNQKKKKSKMNIDVSQSDQYTSYDSEAQTNLQKFQYKQAQVKRQGLRSRSKK